MTERPHLPRPIRNNLVWIIINFGHWSLFRISDFVIRICLIDKQTLHDDDICNVCQITNDLRLHHMPLLRHDTNKSERPGTFILVLVEAAGRHIGIGTGLDRGVLAVDMQAALS